MLTEEQKVEIRHRMGDLKAAAFRLDEVLVGTEVIEGEDVPWTEILTAIDTLTFKPPPSIVLSGDVGKWVRLNDDYQQDFVDGTTGIIVREYRTGPDDLGPTAWDVFVPVTYADDRAYDPADGKIVTVPVGSQVILQEVRHA